MLWSLVIGALAGFLAGQLTRGKGFGLLGNVLVGIVGGVVGGWVFGLLGLAAYGFTGRLLMATVGAALLLWAWRRFVK
jgi:uncharacterized membrane protein YeaQ/YmgE (transglycosylase-associated protein family)